MTTLTKTEAALLARLKASPAQSIGLDWGGGKGQRARAFGRRDRDAAVKLLARGLVTITTGEGLVVAVRRGKGIWVASWRVSLVAPAPLKLEGGWRGTANVEGVR